MMQAKGGRLSVIYLTKKVCESLLTDGGSPMGVCSHRTAFGLFLRKRSNDDRVLGFYLTKRFASLYSEKRSPRDSFKKATGVIIEKAFASPYNTKGV